MIDGQDDEGGGKIESISKKKAEDLIEIIRSGMQGSKKAPYTLSNKREESSVIGQSEAVDNKDENYIQTQSDKHSVISIADELAKLAKLRDQGVIRGRICTDER